jgi:hypothetical protein
MAINTYALLKSSIAAWAQVNVADLSAVIDDIIILGESRINREVRCKDNEAPLAVAIDANGFLPLPAEYRDMKFAYVDGASPQKLERRSAEWIYMTYPLRSSPGVPKFFAREASNMIFGPSPNTTGPVRGVYYKAMPPVSVVAHDLFINNPDLYLFGCLSKTEVLIGRTDKLQVFESEYQRILQAVNLLAKTEDSSGGTLQVRLG